MNKVCVIGHFGFGEELLNGQTVKTKIITKELKKQFGTDEISVIDTHGGKKEIFKLIFNIHQAIKKSKNIIMMPAQNGVQFFSPLLYFCNYFYHKRIHYVVIGGWLPELLEKKTWLKKYLKKFYGIYVETNTMKLALEKQGFKNIYIMANCKELHILKDNELIFSYAEPYKLCTFSRVMKQKGIEDAIEAVIQVNNKMGKVIFSLDIYGQIDSEQIEWFKDTMKNVPTYINYCGEVPFDKSTDVLRDYFALLFPTYYFGEGFAGTLIDALAVGIPVVASDWRYNPDIVKENKTGYIFKTKDLQDFQSKLMELYKEKEFWIHNKKSILSTANEYLPCNVIKTLLNQLD